MTVVGDAWVQDAVQAPDFLGQEGQFDIATMFP